MVGRRRWLTDVCRDQRQLEPRYAFRNTAGVTGLVTRRSLKPVNAGEEKFCSRSERLTFKEPTTESLSAADRVMPRSRRRRSPAAAERSLTACPR
jgi:hypothetical protein